MLMPAERKSQARLQREFNTAPSSESIREQALSAAIDVHVATAGVVGPMNGAKLQLPRTCQVVVFLDWIRKQKTLAVCLNSGSKAAVR